MQRTGSSAGIAECHGAPAKVSVWRILTKSTLSQSRHWMHQASVTLSAYQTLRCHFALFRSRTLIRCHPD